MADEVKEDRLGRDERRARTYRQWLIDVLLLIVCLMALGGLWSWRAVNNMTAATQAKLNGILDKLDAKVDTFDTKNANDVLIEVKGAVADLRKTEQELPGLVRDVRQEIVGLSRGVQALAAETRTQIKQEGDATAKLIADSNSSVNDKLVPAITEAVKATNTLMGKYGLTADEATTALKMAAEKSGKTLDEINKQVANPKWGETADNIAAATGNANLTVADFHTDLHDTMKTMPHIMQQVDKTATNISRFSRVSIIAGIISNLANGLIPGLLH